MIWHLRKTIVFQPGLPYSVIIGKHRAPRKLTKDLTVPDLGPSLGIQMPTRSLTLSSLSAGLTSKVACEMI